MAKKEQMYWQGHPVGDDEHRRKLNLRHADLWLGAGHEGKRLSQHEAEKQVKHEDRQERHAKMAAHHLDGHHACKAVGNHKDAAQHMDLYALHLKQLGHPPVGPVPNEVKKWREAEDKKSHVNFKAGADDHLLVSGDGHVDIKKAEGDDPQANPERCSNCGDTRLHSTSAGTSCQGCGEKAASTPGAHQKLLSYLKGLGHNMEGLSVEDFGPNTPPTRPQPRAIASNPNITPVPSKANLRVVKAEFLPWLAKMSTLAKAQPQPRTPREFSAHKTFLRHRHEPEEKAFDYSSFLEPEQYNSGYRMFVMSHGKNNPVRVHVLHHQMGAGPTWGTKVGGAVGNVEGGDLGIDTYFTHHQHQGQGLEPAMLNAMMHHGKSQMGAYSLSHGDFEPDASALIEAVSKPHGLELGDVEDVDVPEPTNRMSPKTGREGRRPLMVDWDDGR